MSDNVNISFIPKKPLAQSGGFRRQPVFGISFLVSVLISFSLIGYSTYLYFQIQSLEVVKQETIGKLVEYQAELEEDDIINDLDNLRSTAEQIDQAKKLLQSHVALTDLFQYIGTFAPDTIVEDGQTRSFVDPVVFNSFSFNYSEDGITINMNGSAHSYGTLAALSQLYSEKRDTTQILKDFTLTGFSPLSNGRYGINLTATLDPKLISYQCVYGTDDMKREAGCLYNDGVEETSVFNMNTNSAENTEQSRIQEVEDVNETLDETNQ